MTLKFRSLSAEADKIRTGIEAINKGAEAQGRDLTDAEQADSDALFRRLSDLAPEIQAEQEKMRTLDQVNSIVARSVPVAEAKNVDLSAGEYFAAYRSAVTGENNKFRTIAETALSDISGLLPEDIVGNLISFHDASRPVFGSLTPRPMPAKGSTFDRPRISQHVQVGTQATPGDELASRKLIVTSDPVSKSTYGGVLDIPMQVIDWSEPSYLDQVIADFVSIYSEWTEEKACIYLSSLASASAGWSDSSTSAILTSFANAAVSVYNASKRMPNKVWMSLDVWADLAGKVTNEDVSVLELVAQGEAFAKMTPVVGPELPAGTLIVGNSGLVESYEQRKGLLSLVNPGTLVEQVAYSGYAAFHGKSEGFVAIDWS